MAKIYPSTLSEEFNNTPSQTIQSSKEARPEISSESTSQVPMYTKSRDPGVCVIVINEPLQSYNSRSSSVSSQTYSHRDFNPPWICVLIESLVGLVCCFILGSIALSLAIAAILTHNKKLNKHAHGCAVLAIFIGILMCILMVFFWTLTL